MLKMMPRIVRFTAELQSFLQTPLTPPLRLSELRHLALSYSGIGIDCLLDSLELPSLAKLSLFERPGARTTWSTSLISLIHRSPCSDIATLDLALSRYSGSEPLSLDGLIRVTPKLQTLDVCNEIHAFYSHRGSRDHSRLVQALTASPACGTHPVPELQTLLLDYWDDLQVQLFVDMVESRWRVDSPGGPIKRIDCISLRRVPDAAIFDAVAMARMREFVAEGLTLRVEVVAGEYHGYTLIPFDE
ncbi:hypothetical protein FIBSPDRAFT_969082 [Athelia psychrophila]|uniref:F-box domain-containing protein n=1 Tax=Athelia psychrophila TaxID=1759441 RepID=A0A167TW29_9AGAM|nr:hypothetical protein FIBSPDRAFT_969082 [Fibularhizoctonia sp. CBS 109695]